MMRGNATKQIDNGESVVYRSVHGKIVWRFIKCVPIELVARRLKLLRQVEATPVGLDLSYDVAQNN